MTKRSNRPVLRVMVLGLLAVLLMGALVACSPAAETGILTASESQAATPEAANAAQDAPTAAPQDRADATLTYSRCIREHGVPEFPDADAEGRIRIPLDSGITPDSVAFQKASEACKHLAPEGWGDTTVDPRDAEVMLEFARCMRENGVPDYPDPDPSAGARIMFGPVDPNDPKSQAALESCKAILQELQSGPRIGG